MKFKSHRNMSLCVWPQIERELVVTTNDKIAEVGRIERINQEAKPVDGESAMQTIVAQTAWNEDRRTVRIFSFKQVAVHLFFTCERKGLAGQTDRGDRRSAPPSRFQLCG